MVVEPESRKVLEIDKGVAANWNTWKHCGPFQGITCPTTLPLPLSITAAATYQSTLSHEHCNACSRTRTALCHSMPSLLLPIPQKLTASWVLQIMCLNSVTNAEIRDSLITWQCPCTAACSRVHFIKPLNSNNKPGSSVSTVSSYRLGNQKICVQFMGGVEIPSFHCNVETGSGTQPISQPVSTVPSSSLDKAADHSPPSRAKTYGWLDLHLGDHSSQWAVIPLYKKNMGKGSAPKIVGPPKCW